MPYLQCCQQVSLQDLEFSFCRIGQARALDNSRIPSFFRVTPCHSEFLAVVTHLAEFLSVEPPIESFFVTEYQLGANAHRAPKRLLLSETSSHRLNHPDDRRGKVGEQNVGFIWT